MRYAKSSEIVTYFTFEIVLARLKIGSLNIISTNVVRKTWNFSVRSFHLWHLLLLEKTFPIPIPFSLFICNFRSVVAFSIGSHFNRFYNLKFSVFLNVSVRIKKPQTWRRGSVVPKIIFTSFKLSLCHLTMAIKTGCIPMTHSPDQKKK